MKKKMYEAPEVLVVRLTQSTMLAQSAGGPGEDGPTTREWEFQDDSRW